ncbi:hypothetical protein GQ53DRAFT_835683 [Thozetella sp. PMI_491]|nr:hypothetical protein GQ53DRAFT_835683 [Thozetella sp. PMI_491]
MDHPMILTELPFSKASFLEICKFFLINRSIIRVLVRSTVEVFSAQTIESAGNQQRIRYNCRTSGTCTGDLALSATYLPDRFFTYAVVYGCTDDIQRDIYQRLIDSDCDVFHPLILPTIIAELERERHVTYVRETTTRLDRLIGDMTNDGLGENPRNFHSGPFENDDSAGLWLDLRTFQNGMESWRERLVEMIEHTDTLSQTCFAVGAAGWPEVLRKHMNDSGSRIRSRLLELKKEYDSQIRECKALTEGTSLATRLQWNQITRRDTKASLEIASITKRDGMHMRFIAFLTMLFLPGTFAASFFSMTFFDWNAKENANILSPYIWIYVLVSLVITGCLMTGWYRFTRQAKDENTSAV